MPKSWTGTWIKVILGLIAFPFVFFLGLWIFMSATATRLHPKPQGIPSVAYADPLPKWASAVEQGRQFARASLSGENLPGVSVAVGIHGEMVWAEGFGFADLKDSVPVTPGHRFPIGSASTVLTAAAAGLLLENGQLKLDDEIQTHVPAFPKKQWPMTLRALMGHTAGVIIDEPDEGSLYGKHCGQMADTLQYFAKSPLWFQPGTEYHHSNYNWILMSAAVEAAANQPFLSFMQERVFDPLGMRETAADSPPAEVDDDFPLFNLVREKVFDPRTMRRTTSGPAKVTVQFRVTSYWPRYMANPKYGLHLMGPHDSSCYAGSGVFVSTPSDLVRFGMAIQGGKLLRPATVQMLQTSERLSSGTETGYGLGWDVQTVTLGGKPTRMAGYDGDLSGGMVASLMTFPEHGLVVSVMSNVPYADTFSLGRRIAQAFAAGGR
jgi:serine beta-lactamase-like protein LACTB, mitochondrial